MTIMIVIGTRPEIIKTMPVIEQLKSNQLPHIIVWSGQHTDYEMSKLFFEEFKIPEPDINLGIDNSVEITEKLSQMISSLKDVIEEYKPKIIYGVGDTTTTLAAAIVAAYGNVPFVHDEAGMRSFDLSMLEEKNRVLVDSVSAFHFAPTKLAVLNLLSEGRPPSGIRLVGSTAVDAVLKIIRGSYFKENLESIYDVFQLREKDEGIITLTLHRRENLTYAKLLSLFKALDKITYKLKNLKIIFPVHPHTFKKITEYGLLERLQKNPNIIITRPLGYLRFLALLEISKIIITDSGGVQEEAFILSKQTLTLRKITEWPETVLFGYNTLMDINQENLEEKLYAEILKLMNRNMPTVDLSTSPIGDGKASLRIVRTLSELLDRGFPSQNDTQAEAPYVFPQLLVSYSADKGGLEQSRGLCFDISKGYPSLSSVGFCLRRSLVDLKDVIDASSLLVNWDEI